MVAATPSYTPTGLERRVPRHGVTRRRQLFRALLRRALLALLLLLLAIALLAQEGSAQDARAETRPAATRRDSGSDGAARDSRMWYGLAIGGGGTRLACDICDPTRDSGPSVTLSFGAYARDYLRVGVEGSRWSHRDGAARETVSALGLVAHLALPAWRGLYVIGGGGWSGYRAGPFRSDAPRVTLGLGYDVPITQGWVVGNVLSLDASWPAEIKNDDIAVVRNAGLSTLRVGLQIHRR